MAVPVTAYLKRIALELQALPVAECKGFRGSSTARAACCWVKVPRLNVLIVLVQQDGARCKGLRELKITLESSLTDGKLRSGAPAGVSTRKSAKVNLTWCCE